MAILLRTPALAVAFAALLFAGCMATPTPETIPDATLPPVEEVLPTDLQVPTVIPELLLGGGAGEPNIAVGPNGTIYVSAINQLYRSLDGGKSFEDIGPQMVGQGDGDISVDGNGRLHWLGLFGPDAPIPYQYSDRQGRKWSTVQDLSDGTGSDREWIDARGNGTVYASWRDSDAGGIIAARTSFDGGKTWLDRVTMAPDAIGGPLTHGPVDGQVYEAFTTFTNEQVPTSGAKIQLATSVDHGQNWTIADVYDPPQSVQFGLIGFATSIFPVVAADANGTLYVVFSVDQRMVPAALPKPAARFGVFLTASLDQGATWSTPQLLSSSDHASIMPWIAAGAPGRIAVTWYENEVGTPNDAFPDLWNVKLYESITADQANMEGVTVQLNQDPAHIGSVCTAGMGCIAGGDRSLLDFFEVALTSAGQPVVAWSNSAVGYALGIAAKPTTIYFGTVDGTPLR